MMERIERGEGSSPRVRGSHRDVHDRMSGDGIIPAGAGLTRREEKLQRDGRDHPRGCGAHVCMNGFMVPSEGSSPRVRGSQVNPALAPHFGGIIPAGAGLTLILHAMSYTSWDHPRGCGAHVFEREELDESLGSSPRVRGSLTMGMTLKYLNGIIPAGAGLTFHTYTDAGFSGDHPRGCGAHRRR